MISRIGLVLFILLSFTLLIFAEEPNPKEYDRPISLYKPNYLATGLGDDQVKAQLSIQYDVLFPHKIGLHVAYTQLMFWNIYELSRPFREIDFNPDFFWRFESKYNFLNDLDLLFVDFLQIGFYEHLSNGREGVSSRDLNRSYVELQLSVGKFINFGLNFKYFITYGLKYAENPDIMDYIGPFEGKIFINLNNTSKEGKWQFYARCGLGRDTEGGLSFKEGWQEYGMISSVLFSYFRLYAQVHYGYNESLNNYNVKTVNGALGWPLSARVGLSLDLGD